MQEDDFSLGFEDSLFELTGAISQKKEVCLSTGQKKENITVHNDNVDNKYSLEKIFKIIEDRNTSTFKEYDYKLYFENNPEEFYSLLNLEPFKTYSESFLGNIFSEFSAWKEKVKKKVDVKDHYTREQFKDCCNDILEELNYYDSFKENVKKNLYKRLSDSLREKEFDGAIELSEIERLLEMAKKLELWDGESEDGRQEILKWIKEQVVADGCKIENYSDTFIRVVKNKSPLEKLNVYDCIRKLDMEFWRLKHNDPESYNQDLEINNIEIELHNEMMAILEKNKLLLDNVEAYYKDFFILEQARSGRNYSSKLPANYFQFLKTIAVSTYYFTDTQWNDFVRKQGLSSLKDVSVAFILGPHKASTIEDIANLLEDNKTKAIERIIDGDLETYLSHIEQQKKVREIQQAKEIFKNDKNSLFNNVINILRGTNKISSEKDSVEIDDRQSLLALINRNAPVQEMVQYLLKRKTREKLNQRILGDSNDRNDLNTYLKNKNISFICLCLNYLHEFPNESNASGYTNVYEMYANYVLDILIEKNVYNLFYSGLKQLIQFDYVSQEFKDKFNQTSVNMQKDFEIFCNNLNKH